MGWHHHPAREHVGHLGAEVLAHNVQAEIDTCRRARRGEDPTVLHVKHPGIDPNRRESTRQLGGPHPVRGCSAPIEQAGVGQHERARAHRQNARPNRNLFTLEAEWVP